MELKKAAVGAGERQDISGTEQNINKPAPTPFQPQEKILSIQS